MSDNEVLATNDADVETGAIAEEVDASIIRKCETAVPNDSDSDDQANFVDIVKEKGQSEETNVEEASASRCETKYSTFSCYHYVMRQHWAEICLSAVLLLTVLSSLFHAHYAMKTRLVQRKAPSPVRFFPRNSPITDLHDGNGLDVHKLLSMQTQRHGSVGILFVMYYAPWCARSMEARWHMDNLARYFYPNFDDVGNTSSSAFPKSNPPMNGPVHFLAVNCWDPKGQCRQSYRLYSYPIFLAYPGTVNGIYYNGVVSADYMFRFLENVISPFVRLQSEDDLTDFVLDYKTAVIAYFDFRTSRRPIGYQPFYVASLKGLERDPLRAAVKYAVITDPVVALRLNFTRNGQIRLLRLFNETLEYPEDRGYNAKSISTWIFENLLNPIRWVSPSVASAGKSDALHGFLTRKPTLILFAPRQPLFDFSPHYMALTDVALRYFDCPNVVYEHSVFRQVNEIVKQLYDSQRSSKSYRLRLSDFCVRTLREEARLLNDCCDDISPSSADSQKFYDYRLTNICKVCYPPRARESSSFSVTSRSSPSSFCERFFTSEDFPDTMTTATKEFLTPILSSRSCDRLINDFLPKASVIDHCCRQDDKGGPAVEEIMKRFRKRGQSSATSLPQSASDIDGELGLIVPNCEKLRLSRLLRYSYEKDTSELDGMSKEEHLWTGLSCKTNRTFQFASMDANHYGAFARKLGLVPNSSAPLAVIFDDLKEAVYSVDGPLNVDRLGSFIVDFTYNRLSQFYRSEIKHTKSTSDVGILSDSINTQCGSGSICIRSVTSSTFQSMVIDQAVDVLLLYTASWCGACQRLYHLYQTLAYYFRVVDKEIIFAQMDVTTNDLPWQFTSDKIPTLIFFPAGRKSESVVFPSYAPWTLPNLVAFVVAHCQRETRLRFALATCIRNSTGDNAVADSRCLARNRYRTWRALSRVERRIRFLQSEVQRAIQVSTWDWDHDDGDKEWRVYLQRTWVELSKLQLKVRALRTLLTDALRRSHFEAKDE